MSLIRASGGSLVWQIVGFLAMALSGMLTARHLGPADRGLLAAAYLYPQLATSLGSLSLGAAIFHHLGQRKFSLEEFSGTCAMAAAGLGLAVLGLCLAVLRFGGEALHTGVPWHILLLVLMPLPCLFTLGFFSSLLRGAMDIRSYNLVNHGGKLLSLAVVLGLLAAGRLRVWELVIGGAILTVATGMAPVWRMRQHAPGAWRIRWGLLRDLLRSGLRLHAGSVAVFFSGRANLLLANFYLSKAEVGYLYVAVTLGELIWFVSIAAETVLYPQLTRMTESDAAVLTARVCRQILLLSMLGGLALGLLAPVVIRFYGGRAFLPAVTPLRVLVPGIAALTVSKILSALWVRKGWFAMLTMLAGSTGAFSVVLNLILIPRLGTAGAALATALPYLANAAVSILIYRRWVSPDVAALWHVRWSDVVRLSRSLTGRVTDPA